MILIIIFLTYMFFFNFIGQLIQPNSNQETYLIKDFIKSITGYLRAHGNFEENFEPTHLGISQNFLYKKSISYNKNYQLIPIDFIGFYSARILLHYTKNEIIFNSLYTQPHLITINSTIKISNEMIEYYANFPEKIEKYPIYDIWPVITAKVNGYIL